MKLYCSDRSPFARKVRILLRELGIPFEMDVMNALRPVDEFRPLNPALAVPVLVDGEETLFESNLILEYLFARYGDRPPLPAEIPLYRAMRRTGHRWQDAKTLAVLESLGGSIVNISLMTAFGGVRLEESDYLKRQQMRIGSCLDWLEDAATEDGFMPGWFSVLDMALLSHVGFGEVRGIVELGDRANLRALRGKFESRSAVHETRPEPG